MPLYAGKTQLVQALYSMGESGYEKSLGNDTTHLSESAHELPPFLLQPDRMFSVSLSMMIYPRYVNMLRLLTLVDYLLLIFGL